MQIGMVGLGRMGGNITRRLPGRDHEVIVYDHERRAALAQEGAATAPRRSGSTSTLPRLSHKMRILRLFPVSSRISAKTDGRFRQAIDEAVCAEVLSAALFARFRSRRDHALAEKILPAMRERFGGHVEPKAPYP